MSSPALNLSPWYGRGTKNFTTTCGSASCFGDLLERQALCRWRVKSVAKFLSTYKIFVVANGLVDTIFISGLSQLWFLVKLTIGTGLAFFLWWLKGFVDSQSPWCLPILSTMIFAFSVFFPMALESRHFEYRDFFFWIFVPIAFRAFPFQFTFVSLYASSGSSNLSSPCSLRSIPCLEALEWRVRALLPSWSLPFCLPWSHWILGWAGRLSPVLLNDLCDSDEE